MTAATLTTLHGSTKRISSRATRFYKSMFPVFWLGLVVIFICIGIVASLSERIPERALPAFFIVPVVFTLVTFVIRRVFRELIDEVYDGGDHLLLRNGTIEERLPLTNVMNVSASELTNPPRITLKLVKAGRFGSEVSFLPVRSSFLPFARIPIADDLIARVDQARMRRVI